MRFAAIFDDEIMHGYALKSNALNHYANRAPLTLQHVLEKAQIRSFIALLRDKALKDLTRLIDGSPQIVGLAVNLYEPGGGNAHSGWLRIPRKSRTAPSGLADRTNGRPKAAEIRSG